MSNRRPVKNTLKCTQVGLADSATLATESLRDSGGERAEIATVLENGTELK